MNTTTRSISKAGKVYNISVDEYGDLDCVECNGEYLSATNAVVKQILNNFDKIKQGVLPYGFKEVGR